MSLGNNSRIVPYYLLYFNSLFLLIILVAAAPSILLLCLPMILAALHVVGYFEPDAVRRGLKAAGRILLAYTPAMLFVLLVGLRGRGDFVTPWSEPLLLIGALASYLISAFAGPGLIGRSQRVVIEDSSGAWARSALAGEISSSSTVGHVSLAPGRAPGREAGMLASLADEAAAPGSERRNRFGLPCRVDRFKRDSPAEPAEVDAEVDMRRLWETTLGRIPVEVAHLYGEEEWRDPSGPIGRFLMRAFDILAASAAILVLSPLFAVAAAAVMLEDGGPAIFRQIRIGRDGRPFVLYKFRTMKRDGFDEADPNSNMESRILRTGRLLRKTHIDETLQFFNVLGGSMSLVGPRPELPVYHERGCREIPAYSHRLGVRPGITGWAQVRYPHTTSIDEYRVKTSYDLWYIRNRSGWVNLTILLLTVRAVLFGMGK